MCSILISFCFTEFKKAEDANDAAAVIAPPLPISRTFDSISGFVADVDSNNEAAELDKVMIKLSFDGCQRPVRGSHFGLN
mmetsp:Transcript_2460/g.3279  ORF Transcript_2460/g.3279 Transcript_2460/m.3279 type:complete len:80 (-) Transcript_2460:54-293(-)